MWLAATLQPAQPLPPFRGWVIDPEVGRLLVEAVLERRPNVVVECGAGLSTLLIGYALKRAGGGRLLSLEHHAGYVRHMRAQVEAHGLAGYVQVIEAPLVTTSIREQTWKWYDLPQLVLDASIDLLFVDGPPGDLQACSRYPAGPRLMSRLAEGGLVILDDAPRRDEQAIIHLWRMEFPELTTPTLAAAIPARAAVLERAARPAADASVEVLERASG